MTHYAIPVVAFVEATDLDSAYAKVADTLNTHPLTRGPDDMPCILDEVLDGFVYDPASQEIHSALDDPANANKSRE